MEALGSKGRQDRGKKGKKEEGGREGKRAQGKREGGRREGKKGGRQALHEEKAPMIVILLYLVLSKLNGFINNYLQIELCT